MAEGKGNRISRRNFIKGGGLVVGGVAISATGLLVSACSNGVSQEDLDAAKAQLQGREQELAQLQKQLAAIAPTTITQAGQLQPAPAGANPSGWDTTESIRSGWRLFATYDSSGPDAWDVKAHPLVYFTSEGMGYRHRPAKTEVLPGVQAIDGNTKQVIASAGFKLGGTLVMQPHGLAISPGGEWLYIGDVEDDPATKERRVYIYIINGRTLKLDKVLARKADPDLYYLGAFHHGAGFTDWLGRGRVLIMGGFGAIGGPHIILDPKNNNKVVMAITADEVRPMGHPYPNFDPTGKFIYLSLDAPWISEAEGKIAAMAKFNLETGKVTATVEGVGNHPVGVAWTSDGKFTYVNDGTNSLVYKIDNGTNKVVGHSSAAVAGPYGNRLNWDETLLYTIGKGEGSHNTGGVVGVIDLKTFRALNTINQPIDIGGATMDHGILHPDPEVNEMWVSSAGTWETIVMDTKTNTVKARIPSPNGGDTHSGGFVRYKADWTGELLFDMGGPSKASYEIMKAKVAAKK